MLVLTSYIPDKFVAILKKFPKLFWVLVVFPLSISAFYYAVLASDVYVSESRFVVRSPDQPSMTGLGGLLKSTGFSNASDKIYATKDYLTSRDSLESINHNGEFEAVYSDHSISMVDRFNGFGFQGNFEDLYQYYKRKVEVKYDSTSSITTLTVRAYSPEAAKRFNEQLLGLAENAVNQMSERGQKDLVRLAELEVGQAKEKAQDAALALAAYRNNAGILDPEKQASVQMQMISKLQDQLIATRTQLVQLRALAASNPQIPVLTAEEQALSREIQTQLRQVTGGKGSLAATAVRYERLLLESEFAGKQLASAFASLEEARSEARRKKAYVERVVNPNLPDYPLEPRRWRGIFTTFILGVIAWGILSMLISGMLEHRD